MASASGWPYNKPLVINHQMDAPRAQEMAVLKNSTTQITDWRHKLQYRLKEGALIALGAMCLYLLMALLTYNVADPAWDNSVQVERIINAGGSIGAWLSSALFGALGYFAYIFPLLLAAKTWQVFRTRNQPWHWNGWLFSWHSIGLVFLILSGAALGDIHFAAAAGMQGSGGGMLGASLGDLAVHALNVQGSTLIFLALFLFGLTVFTDLSWFRVMDLTGKITLDLLELIHGAITSWWNARSERKQMKIQLRELDERVIEVAAGGVRSS